MNTNRILNPKSHASYRNTPENFKYCWHAIKKSDEKCAEAQKHNQNVCHTHLKQIHLYKIIIQTNRYRIHTHVCNNKIWILYVQINSITLRVPRIQNKMSEIA